MKKVLIVTLGIITILFLGVFICLGTNHYNATENAIEEAKHYAEESNYISCEKEGATTRPLKKSN